MTWTQVAYFIFYDDDDDDNYHNHKSFQAELAGGAVEYTEGITTEG